MPGSSQVGYLQGTTCGIGSSLGTPGRSKGLIGAVDGGGSVRCGVGAGAGAGTGLGTGTVVGDGILPPYFSLNKTKKF